MLAGHQKHNTQTCDFSGIDPLASPRWKAPVALIAIGAFRF